MSSCSGRVHSGGGREALVGLELGNASDYDQLIDRMQAQNINFQHINNNPMLFEMLV